MSVCVLSPGALTTVQDGGRNGYGYLGFNASGVMDERAYRIANALVGNFTDEAVLEMAMLGGRFEFTAPCLFAVTGADMGATLSGEEIRMYQTIFADEGDVLAFSAAKTGFYTYIAFAGGIDVEPVLGSRSTNLKCGIGGFQGRKLQKGDVLALREPALPPERLPRVRVPAESYAGDTAEVRVVLGPQDDYFIKAGLQTFLSAPYRVTANTDRMGCKLDGAKIEYKDGVDIISDGIVFGSIQVPPAGTPMVMLADRQTTGGYAKIATVASADLPKIVQRRPGDTVYFRAVSARQAEKLYKKEQRALDRLLLRYGKDLVR